MLDMKQFVVIVLEVKKIDYLNESTNFYSLHCVECYIIKDGICVARDKISISIDYD